ncbi:MAG: zinc-ribbon domain-containing protein [Pseudomonadota bacterium]|nr:zinc-ribbon domain-containing protein [Pseudomonadota bacterium]
MSLATRCTSCGTAFRVVQDQLKVSEGWVRCGRCNAVFNALEGLFDLGRDAPPEWEEPVEPLVASFAAPAAEWATLPPPAGDVDDAEDARAGDDEGPTSNLGELLADPIDAHLFGPRKRAEAAPKPAGQIGARDRVEFSDARFDSDLFLENTSIPDTELATVAATDADASALESSVRPEFIRRADRRARWQSTSVRVALGIASIVAVIVLAAQAANHYRDIVAARWPALRPVLAAWCRAAECRIEAPRRIDEVLVESTALTRAAGQDAFVLSVTLRSRSELTLALPSIDLTLTDANGHLVARRALAPRDFRAADVIAPHAETGLQVLLAGTPSVVGYTVEIFYP